MVGTFNCLTSIVANGCLLDNLIVVFHFLVQKWPKNSNKITNIFDDILGFVISIGKKS
jgi:hypothetical protein